MTVLNRYMRAAGMLLPAVLLAACATSGDERAYHPETDARVRVYWGPVVYFHFDTACVPVGNAPERKGKTLLVSKPGLSALRNKTVGMPLPPDAGRYYKEYVVPANQPLTITARFSSQSVMGNTMYVSTTPDGAGTFVPAAGRDYEVLVDGSANTPQVQVRQLHDGGGAVTTTPVAVSSAPECR